jgi:hypothetical protein
VRVAASCRVLVRDGDQEVSLPLAGIGEGIGLVDHQILKTAIAQHIALLYGIKPADHALAAGAGAEFELLEFGREGVVFLHLGEKGMGADLGIVGLGDTEGVDRLHRNAGAFEELGCKRVRCSNVGRIAVAFVEPVGLAEFSDHMVRPAEVSRRIKFADFTNVSGQRGARLPIGFGEELEIEGEWAGTPRKPCEVELGGSKTGSELDGLRRSRATPPPLSLSKNVCERGGLPHGRHAQSSAARGRTRWATVCARSSSCPRGSPKT